MKQKNTAFSNRIALGLACILIFTYTLYHLIGMFDSTISTYAAGVTSETTVLTETGYIFRDETVLTSSYSGVVDYHVKDGTKVSAGQNMATVYENGTSAVKSNLRRMDDRLSVLAQSSADALANVDMTELKEDVSTTYNALIKMMAEGKTGGLSYYADQMLMGLNRMDVAAKGSDAISVATEQELRAMRADLLAASGSSQTYSAGKSGYFYSQTDGYETYFTMNAAAELTADSFYRIIGKKAATSYDGQKAYGKISYTSEWLFVLPISEDDGEYFEVGETYSACFEENNQTDIPLTLERVISDEDREQVLLVFRGDRLPEHFSFDRSQTVSMEVERISGIYVPKSVVTRVDGFRGVYVLRGNVVHFRYIDIMYEGSDYYLVKEGVADDEERTYLRVNDLIILNGKNMFDGRVLD